MKYLVVAPGYPREENKYNNAFVHSRVKQYLKKELKVDVFSIEKNFKFNQYEYDGVHVLNGNYEDLKNHLMINHYDKILIHFGFKKIINSIINTVPDTPLIIWVHGVEALGWYRRIFAFEIKKPHRFLGYILLNTRQLIFMHRFIRKHTNHTFVFVSEWMKDVLEKDSLSKNKIINYRIIPNVVDTDTFNYVKKDEGKRLNILSIRPYASKKYANDLSVKAIKNLSKMDYFDELQFTLYGDGKLFDKTLKSIRKFKNVEIIRKFLSQKEISQIHKKNGIMLIPTRQDAQGVSMCEAMSSGLVAISSNNTAIPEYLNNECGYVCDCVDDMVCAIDDMYKNPQLFLEKSKKASKFISKVCAPDVVIEKEIDLILSKIGK